MSRKRNRAEGIPLGADTDTPTRLRKIEAGPDAKSRLLFITLLAVGSAMVISLLAKGMVLLIDVITNVAFHGKVSLEYIAPGENHLGWWVVCVPVIGGVIVGFMARYGSKAIRGHGIPEAMEMILTNQSKIKPAITYLKPLSAAISIGSGGPFGAEGPIISTGGALGSMVGQLLRITPNERKVLLAAGATAGMSAIFGSPIAAIFLAIELLLFEFAPRSLLPVAMACITGAAGHHVFFGTDPMFAMPAIVQAGNAALFAYSLMGLVVGLLALLITKVVYLIEDGFEHLPVHWMWWPAIGGVAVGVVGYFAPRTLGVGYENITDLLSGSAPMQLILSLALLKLLSWLIALGSGTSGGTLAPLMTIGGAIGCLLGMVAQWLFPSVGVVLPLAVLVGMASMFAGASRAFLTSVVFALETTGRIEALLPLLGACAAAYLVSYFLMTNTIMTERIARRGIRTPDSYEPDVLEQMTVEQIMVINVPEVNAERTVAELLKGSAADARFFFITSTEGLFEGVVAVSDLRGGPNGESIGTYAFAPGTVQLGDDLRMAARLLAGRSEQRPLVVEDDGAVVGLVSHADILKAYGSRIHEHEQGDAVIILKRRRLKVMAQGKRMFEKVVGRG